MMARVGVEIGFLAVERKEQMTEPPSQLEAARAERDATERALGRSAVATGMAAAVTAAFAISCVGSVATLSPEAAGCYRIFPSGWSATHSRVTGLRSLPPMIALDTAYLGRIIVPESWRDQQGRGCWASLDLYSLPWEWLGDWLVFDSYSAKHALANDSAIVTFRGWGGFVVAYLERRETRYEGWAFFGPRPLADSIPGIRILLERSECTPELKALVSARLARP